jgi:hypothetical protein
MSKVTISTVRRPVRSDNHRGSTLLHDSEGFIHKVNSLQSVKMLKEVVAINLLNAVIRPRPRISTDFQNDIDSLHGVLINPQEPLAFFATTTQIEFHFVRTYQGASVDRKIPALPMLPEALQRTICGILNLI